MHRRLRTICIAAFAVALFAGESQAQSLRDVFDELFVFGSGGEQLFLAGSAGVSSTQIHGAHFIPSRDAGNGALLDFLTSAIAINVSSFPLPSTTGSQTFKFVDGVPTPTSNSFGPIFAERVQTVGRGRLNAGMNYSRQTFRTLRGTRLDDVDLAFTHVDVDFEGCDEAVGGDCSEFGIPQVENDVINLNVNLGIDAEVFAFFATFGLTDRIDFSVAVPVVSLSLDGVSTASVDASTTDRALHFFGGTPENPVLEAKTAARGSTTGLGDVAVRLKGQITNNPIWNIGVLGEARIPTGREEDFLGTGDVNARGLVIVSGLYDQFSPHVNMGFEYRGSEFAQNEFDLALGFDQLLSSWATVAIDLLGSFKLGDSALTFPEPVIITAPFRRVVERTNIRDLQDDIIDAAIGFKFRTGGGIVLIANALIALNDGGLRSAVTPTFGIEYLF
ncbi:MAG: transporter [Gemmatimonadota bacterium]